MLKLLMFAPCERVIMGGEGDNSGSLIAILQGFDINASDLPSDDTPEGERPIPIIPMPWYVFTLWEDDYSGQNYRQRFELRSPRQKLLLHGDGDFTFSESKRFHRVSSRLPGIPIDGFGDYVLTLFLKTGDGEFIERGQFPIPINPSKQT